MGKQSKIWVQGSNQSLICMFVFQELPLLYKEVCLRKPTFSSLNPPKKTTRAKPLPFQCNLCKKKTTFKSMPDMKMHMKVTHKNTDITPQRKPTRAIGRPNVINISVSSDLLDSENDLTLYKSVSQEEETTIMTYKCTFCDNSFLELHKVSQHERENHSESITVLELSCEMCVYKTSNQNEMSEHLVSNHCPPEATELTCEQCEYKTVNKNDIFMLLHSMPHLKVYYSHAKV